MKDAKKAAGRLGTAIERLQDALNDPNVPDYLLNISPTRELDWTASEELPILKSAGRQTPSASKPNKATG